MAKYDILPTVSRLVLLVLYVNWGQTVSIPKTTPPTTPAGDGKQSTQKVIRSPWKYLTSFGYLPPSEFEKNGELRSQEELEQSIRNLQKFANLNVTGQLDDETQKLLKRPRCGMADHVRSQRRQRRYHFAGPKWPTTKRHMTYKISRYSGKLSNNDVRRAVYDAFQVWQKASVFTFNEVMSQEKADIEIQFASGYHQDGYPFDGRGIILAHAFYPGSGRGGDTHFDEDENWTVNGNYGTNLFMVAAHEFGHALGLAHSSVPGSLMFPWYQGFQGDEFRLPNDDRTAVQILYGSPMPPVTKTNPGVAPTRPSVTERPSIPKEVPYTVLVPEPTTPTPRPIDVPVPITCDTDYDAITVFRHELFIFKDKWLWRRQVDSKGLFEGPVKLNAIWYGLPVDIDYIDAVYERPDKKIIFFRGDRYFELDGNHLIAGFPKSGRPISEYGFPADIKKIDAVFIWGYNKKTYFITNDMYWRINEDTQLVEEEYPHDMSIWRGVELPVDTAFQHWDGYTYFFRGRNYWRFNDERMAIETEGYPQPSAIKFMNCSPEKQKEQLNTTVQPTASGSSHNAHRTVQFAFIAIGLILFSNHQN